jgi:(1->4)-alpha-D-glucan 1-alpha-D-glucosylmutase
VDPDNRRPVDFARRAALLDALRARIPAENGGPPDLTSLCAELLDHWRDGRVKLYLTHRALTLRRRRARLFAVGEYRGLAAGGHHAEHVVALARLDGPDAVIAVVPRLTARLGGLTGRFALGEAAWEQTWVALGDDRLAGAYRDRFTGLTVRSERRDGVAGLPVSALLGHFPVALLEREGDQP